jgi:hypothetical protein
MSTRSTTAANGGSVHSSTLLSPPESPSTVEDIPFKPKDGDSNSLRMKRRHKGRHYDSRLFRRACLSSNDLKKSSARESTSHRPSHSRSLPALSVSNSFLTMKANPHVKPSGPGSPDRRRRRWTLPSKAASTQGLLNTVSVETKTQNNPARKENDSPAMITLRRATTAKSSRKMSLTFFPEPKFQTRSSFLSKFLSTIAWQDDKTSTDFSEIYRQDTRRSSRAGSIDSGKAKGQPSSSDSAPTVCTEVSGMEPRLSIPGRDSRESPLRRCSTRFISAGSVYEVIWDDRGSSSTSDSPPSQPERMADGRRRSVAVEQLETQLFRAVAQYRRESLAVQEQLSMISSSANQTLKPRRPSLGEMLTFQFSRFANEAALQNVPRSKSSSNFKSTSPALRTIATAPGECRGTQPDQAHAAIEFFPPVKSRATTDASKHSPARVLDASASERPSTRSLTPPEPALPRTPSQAFGLGNLVGASTHIRRRSTAPDAWFSRRRSNAFNGGSRRSSAFISPKARGVVEDETTMPLLRNVGTLE